jgi:hypothetical protein
MMNGAGGAIAQNNFMAGTRYAAGSGMNGSAGSGSMEDSSSENASSN